MVHIVSGKVTRQQMDDMLGELKTYVKFAIDVRRRIVSGGGALHADCEAALLEEGGEQADIWGADWYPSSGELRFDSLINIRPKQGNRSLTISDPALRATIEAIVRERLSP